MKTILVLVAVAALFVAGCGGGGGTFNVDEEFSKKVGSKAVCLDAGFEEVAGERETVYSCSFAEYGYEKACIFIVDGDFHIARYGPC